VLVVRPPASFRTRRSRTISGWGQQRRARDVLERDRGICHLCGLAGADQADHLVPLAEGGTDDMSNMAAAHRLCHQAKGRRGGPEGPRAGEDPKVRPGASPAAVMEPPEVLRRELAAARGRGENFDRAWSCAMAHALQDARWQAEWTFALTATRPAWEAAYGGRGAARLVEAMRALEIVEIAGDDTHADGPGDARLVA